MTSSIEWNPKVKLILADVDETIADVYTDATPEMVSALNKLLSKDIVLFMVSGGGLQSIRDRVSNKINAELRKNILIAHCSGAEVWGFEEGGNINSVPFYGLYDSKLNDSQKTEWRVIINLILEKYHLKTFPTMSQKSFVEKTGGDPLSIMLADRGPQITFEFPNSINLTEKQKTDIETELNIKIPKVEGVYDLRYPILEDLKEIYVKKNLPISPKFAGVFALDNPLAGVDKTLAIDYVLKSKNILKRLELDGNIINKPEMVEIWGDKFAEKGGSDFLMCKAVSANVRTIDFRNEDRNLFAKEYNIEVWNGKKHLHEGLLEYLEKSLN